MNHDHFRQSTINTVVFCIETSCSAADAQTIIGFIIGLCLGGPYLTPHLQFWSPLINAIGLVTMTIPPASASVSTASHY